MTPRESLEFFASLQGINPARKRDDIRKLLSSLRLEEKVDTPARKLSRGMQQELGLAAALIRESELLLLDEPGAIYRLLERIEEGGAQVISLNKGTPDLEEVFLNIVQGGENERYA